MDGKTGGKLIPFALINVDPKTSLTQQYIEALLMLDNEPVPVTLERNNLGDNFAADLNRLIPHGTQASISLTLPAGISTFDLAHSMPDENGDTITWQDALKIAATHLEPKLRAAGGFEAFVKIITDDTRERNVFWYVQFITTNNIQHFAVLTPNGTIIC
jgi:hypothetical protein